jgi:hypothetical protein
LAPGVLRRKGRGLGLAWLAFVLSAPAVHAAPKTDVVVLKNGDRITGEVEQLERGYLTFETDDIGKLQIEWDKVQSVTATAPFDVDDVAGNRYLGSLEKAPTGQVVIAWRGKTETVELRNIVRMRRLDTSFWRRLDGSIDAGASYTSASELFKLDLAAAIGVERPGYEVHAEGTSTVSTQPDVDDTRRSDLSLVYARRFRGRWLALVQGLLEQNRELGFELRGSAAAGGGRYVVRGRRDKLLLGLGLSLNRERPVEGESTTNVEAMALVNYDRFAYDFPKLDVSVTAAGFASLEGDGRYRVELDMRLKRELLKDFYATLRGYESYDSRPATAGAPNNDYGVTFALGWSF